MQLGRHRLNASHPALVISLALFTFVLVSGPFQHHDFVCHLNSRTHCVSCVSSESASGLEQGAALATGALPKAGTLHGALPLSADTLLPARTTGRSPPA